MLKPVIMNFDFFVKSSAPAFCGCYPVSLPLPLKLVPINVVVPWHCQQYKKSFGRFQKEDRGTYRQRQMGYYGKGGCSRTFHNLLAHVSNCLRKKIWFLMRRNLVNTLEHQVFYISSSHCAEKAQVQFTSNANLTNWKLEYAFKGQWTGTTCILK